MSAGSPSRPTVDLSVNLGPLRLRNPILTASGTFGYGIEFAEVADLSLLGGIVCKSISRAPRDGNPMPRIVETASGLLNSIGLENPGVDAFVKDYLPVLTGIDTAVVVSVAGNQPDDFLYVVKALKGHERVDGLELNVSCPNQAEGGMAFGTDPGATASLVERVRLVTDLPLIVKLTPNVTDIAAVASAAVVAGADALCVVNTFLGLAVDWRTRAPQIAGIRGRGGLSGPAIKPLALRCVRDVFEAVDVPVVGAGGIMTADDALDFVVAGATAVEVGTGCFVNPALPAELPGQIAERLVEEGSRDIVGLVGTLRDAP